MEVRANVSYYLSVPHGITMHVSEVLYVGVYGLISAFRHRYPGDTCSDRYPKHKRVYMLDDITCFKSHHYPRVAPTVSTIYYKSSNYKFLLLCMGLHEFYSLALDLL